MRTYNYFAVWRDFHFSTQEVSVGLLVLFIILVFGFITGVRKSETNPLYKYYFKGLVLKMMGSLTFALVYALYYRDGGDTIAYYYGADALKNLFYQDFSVYLEEIFNKPTNENFFNHYSEATGWPPEWLYRSSRHFFLCKIVSVVCIFIPGSFLGVTFFMGFICYVATWQLFKTVTFHFPTLTKYLQVGILLLPSTLFWCSGIMKDTLVLAGICWIVHETDLFLRPEMRKKRIRFILRFIIWGWIILSCKPYVVIAIAPAWLLWMNYTMLSKIKSSLVRYYLIPVFIIGSSIAVFQIYSVSTQESEFSPDNMLDRAMIVRNDFATNTTYGGNRFNAVAVEKTGTSIVTAIPQSVIAGLFRPFIWEARSPFVFASGVENLFLLIYFIYAVYKLRIRGFIKFVRSHPFLLFSLIFSFFFAFIVGFTTILFGALIRFRTPLLPFFISFVIIAVGKIRSMKIVTGYSSTQIPQS